MKKLIAIFFLLLMPVAAHAQFSSTMQSGAVANGNGSVLQTTNMGTAVLNINCSSCGGGTQINFEALGNGEPWFAILGNKIGTTTTATTTTTSGTQMWSFDVAGVRQIRARISAYSAGTITIRGDSVAPDGSDAASISATASGSSNIGSTTDVACIATDATPCTVIGALKGGNLLLQTPVGPATAANSNPVVQSYNTLASGAITSAMTGTTSTSLIGATASNYIYVTQCTTSNSSTTVPTDILLQDGNGGTTLYVLPAPAGSGTGTGASGGSFTFPVPLKVTTSGNALYAANVTTSSSTKISCSGFKSTISY